MTARIVLGCALFVAVARPALACPPGCARYHPYYVVVASGPDSEEVAGKAREIAKAFGAEFRAMGQEDKDCPSERCIGVLDANRDPYLSGERTPKAMYAAVYLVRDGYKDAGRKAEQLITRIKKQLREMTEPSEAVRSVKGVYKKALDFCACE